MKGKMMMEKKEMMGGKMGKGKKGKKSKGGFGAMINGGKKKKY